LQRPVLALVAASGWLDGVKALLAMKEERKLGVDATDEQVGFASPSRFVLLIVCVC
jgi:hypothetical protein